MTHIHIDEIKNGFVVEFFADYGPAELDKTVFCKDWTEVLKVVNRWRAEEALALEEKKT